MANNKPSKVKLYSSFDLLPIYNFYKFNETDDLRYLIYNVNLNNLPNCETNNLEEQFIALLSTYDKVDLKRQILFAKAFKQYVKFKLDGLNEQECYQTFHDFREYLDKLYKDFRFEDLIFSDTLTLQEYIKQKYGKSYLLNHRLHIYSTIKATPKFKFELYKDKLFIQKVLGTTVDDKKTGCTEFFILRDEAIKQNKPQQKNGR